MKTLPAIGAYVTESGAKYHHVYRVIQHLPSGRVVVRSVGRPVPGGKIEYDRQQSETHRDVAKLELFDS